MKYTIYSVSPFLNLQFRSLYLKFLSLSHDDHDDNKMMIMIIITPMTLLSAATIQGD
jgi:hypothetical protein